MRYEHSSKDAPRSPHCPSCARIMRFARASRFGDLYIQYVFECRACGVSHIEAAPLAVKLDAADQSSEKASCHAAWQVRRIRRRSVIPRM
jgi:hypothetical protein